MITCFNRDKNGECLAYNEDQCSNDCQARIKTIEEKISLISCLLLRVNNKKDKKKLNNELLMAKQAKAVLDEGKFEGWMSCYMEDLHRGSGGGQSESDSNAKTSLKQKMKDNRPVGIKPTRAKTEEYKEALHKFEEEVGEKMEKLGRSGISHSKVDSYTKIPICFVDDGAGTCRGQRSKADKLSKDCKGCSFLSSRVKDEI